jgi:hypothetical protein
VSNYTVEGSVIHSLNQWTHIEAGIGQGTFPCALIGAYIEPTANTLIGFHSHYDLSSTKLGPSLSNELFWRQRIGDNSEYRLKYQFDQQHRLGAKWAMNYPDSKISLHTTLAKKVIGAGLTHTKQLTDNLSLKVTFNITHRLRPKLVSPKNCYFLR